MKHIKVVLGANFGDEGKGMTARHFTKEGLKTGSVLNVLFNGGVQRGHTAAGHVFHCFGSGAIDGATTFYTPNFMVNPIGWNVETSNLGFYPQLIISPFCRVTTPFDIVINQAVEKKRNENRHGSCGMGILETRLRSKEFPITMRDLRDEHSLYEKLKIINEVYYPKRCLELGIDTRKISVDDFMASAYLMHTKEGNVIVNTSPNTPIQAFDTTVYEGGQGLLLSEDNNDYFPNLTPSFTGSQIISREINKSGVKDVEVCYVTRSYMTRHGAGRFDTECEKDAINPFIVDRTNMPNDFQGSLRFGYLDIGGLKRRIKNDIYRYLCSPEISVAVTQLNYTNGKLCCENNEMKNLSELSVLGKIYKSYEEDSLWV